MTNFNIKAKHQETMTCFFASKNFELKTRKQTPPPLQNKDPKATGKAAPPQKKDD